MLTFTDGHSRKMFVYLLRDKSKTLKTFKMFKSSVEKQAGKEIKCLRSDNGGE